MAFNLEISKALELSPERSAEKLAGIIPTEYADGGTRRVEKAVTAITRAIRSDPARLSLFVDSLGRIGGKARIPSYVAAANELRMPGTVDSPDIWVKLMLGTNRAPVVTRCYDRYWDWSPSGELLVYPPPVQGEQTLKLLEDACAKAPSNSSLAAAGILLPIADSYRRRALAASVLGDALKRAQAVPFPYANARAAQPWRTSGSFLPAHASAFPKAYVYHDDLLESVVERSLRAVMLASQPQEYFRRTSGHDKCPAVMDAAGCVLDAFPPSWVVGAYAARLIDPEFGYCHPSRRTPVRKIYRLSPYSPSQSLAAFVALNRALEEDLRAGSTPLSSKAETSVEAMMASLLHIAQLMSSKETAAERTADLAIADGPLPRPYREFMGEASLCVDSRPDLLSSIRDLWSVVMTEDGQQVASEYRVKDGTVEAAAALTSSVRSSHTIGAFPHRLRKYLMRKRAEAGSDRDNREWYDCPDPSEWPDFEPGGILGHITPKDAANLLFSGTPRFGVYSESVRPGAIDARNSAVGNLITELESFFADASSERLAEFIGRNKDKCDVTLRGLLEANSSLFSR